MKKVLGLGLSALIPDSYISEIKKETEIKTTATKREMPEIAGFSLIAIDKIKPNHDQPRKIFNDEKIKELADSIKEKGVLQPVIVKKVGSDNYELICGERRFRAASLCGLKEIPAVVKDVAASDFLEWALIENIQREDLNPLEEAEAYERLAVERMISHEEIAKRLGKSRTNITNTLRLLRLPDEVKILVANGFLSEGHARALLGMLTPEHQRQLAKRIAEENLSVRQVEAIVNRSNAHKRKAKRARQLSAEIMDIERRLTQHLGVPLKIYPRKDANQGRIELYYCSLDDFDRIIEKVGLPRS